MKRIGKPKEGEFPPSAIMYIALLPNDGMVLSHLEANLGTTPALIGSLPQEKLTYRYSEGKWTIKEVLGHVIDDERIYSYRALRIARGDRTELAGFEPEDYVRTSAANERDIDEILNDYVAVRISTLSLFRSFNDEALLRTGLVNGNTVSVSAAIYHVAGHELHHLKIIKERYS